MGNSSMATKTNFFTIISLIFVIPTTTTLSTEELHRPIQQAGHGNGNVKLFVFGDSYADTGNCRESATGSWKEPYGITFPGKPAGRFSDGRVLTDYIASYYGIRSPVSYNKWKKTSVNKSEEAEYGMNFAYGGTGVFNTMVNEPNMTTQLDFFQHLLEEKVYTKHDLNSSIALVSLAGNDYAAFLLKNGNLQDLPSFMKSVIEQLVLNLKRIRGLGVGKIAVTGMEPMGCLPQLAASYQNCSESWNSASKFHNQILQSEVQKLNNEEDVIFTLDLYSAFMSALSSMKKENNASLMEPCCVGVSNHYSCGSIDESGGKKYIVCKNPESSFFWDNIHPSQRGWRAVYSALQSSLPNLHY